MLNKIALSILLFLFAAMGASPKSQSAVSIGGDWNFSVSLEGREINAIMTIIQEGENIKVSIKYRTGGERTGTGQVKGNEIEWTEIIKNISEKVTVVTEGKIEQKTNKKDISQEFIYRGKIKGNVITGYLFPKNNETKRFDWKAIRKIGKD